MPNRKMTIPVYQWESAKNSISEEPVDMAYDMPFSNMDPKLDKQGMPTSKTSFLEMLKLFITHHGKDPAFDIKYVEFSKASVFRILSQPGCEHIRFYFGMPAPDRLTLLLEGVKEDGKPIGLANTLAQLNNSVVADDPSDGLLEEKGNGGKGNDDVVSVLKVLQEIISRKGQGFVENNFDNPALLQELLEGINA